MDEVYWRETPQRAFITPPTIEAGKTYEPIIPAGVQAIQILQEADFYSASQRLSDPKEGFLDLEKTGLQVIGFNQEGIIFLDNSGRLTAGMDISTLLDIDGNRVIPKLLANAQSTGLDHLYLEGVWPHPATQRLDPVSIWCGYLTPDEIICALAWPVLEEKTP